MMSGCAAFVLLRLVLWDKCRQTLHLRVIYSKFMAVVWIVERLTGVPPDEAAHHCSAHGRRISLLNITRVQNKEAQLIQTRIAQN